MDEIVRLLADHGPFGLSTLLFGFLWWQERQGRQAIDRDYREHLAEEIRALRELRS